MELQLRSYLGTARTFQFGWQHPQVRDALEPAYRLAKELQDTELLGPIFWLLSSYFATRGGLRTNAAMVEEFRSVATASENQLSDLPIYYHLVAGNHGCWAADLDRAVEQVQQV